MSKNSLALYKYTDDQISLIKRTIAAGTTDDELELFLYTAQRLGLDPLAKQIYAVKYKNQMVIQTSIDGYRCVADKTGQYAPGRDTTFTYDEKNKLISATSFVKKQTADGVWHEISATAFMTEYKGTTHFWSKFPHVMLEKCAEARALRRCFPSQLSGVYTREEMDQAETQKPITVQAKIDKPKQGDIYDALLQLKKDIKPHIMKVAEVNDTPPQKVWWDLVYQVLGPDYCISETQDEVQALERWDLDAISKMRKSLLE